ncbi:UbiD family decarboxylase [Natrinema gelatinilyticum]|uniref:UbiD family decarboxylase n=1 Tax=Natrinema gelatinilyticum TaxID=2961571 RepID=UPI0020C4F909|nr:UbiD family decarboxylase [Natrinema gelatinilyticum]
MKDLRSYLARLEERAPNELERIEKEVDPEFEIAGLVRKFQEEDEYPAVLCENIEGYPNWRVLTNVCASDRRIAEAIDSNVDEMLEDYIDRVENRNDPEYVDDGSVKDVVKTGDDASLNDIPLLTHTPAEPAPFLDGEVFVCYDEENDRYNTGIYRMMKKDKQKTGVFFAQGTHAYSILGRHEAEDEPMEFAAYIGHHPAAVFGCQVHTIDDEYSAIGGVLDEPLQLVDCETVDLKVPANAELVIEGRVLPNVREREGPFCEFTYLLGKERESPVTEITAITHREDPIYYDVYNPYIDHVNHGKLPMEADIYRKAKDAVSQVTDVYMPPEASRTVAIIQVKKEYEGIGKQAAIAAASAKYFPKPIVVVDEEQDPRDLADVWWAISMKTRPDRDFNFIKDAYVEDLIPVATTGEGWPNTDGGVDTKVFIDATKPLDVEYPPHCEPPEEVWKNIDLDEYVNRPAR